MILDMLYEHARQVGCASHCFRLSCSACEVGELPDAGVVDILQKANLAGDTDGSKGRGPKLLIRNDPDNLLQLDSDPEIGVTVTGLQDITQELKRNCVSGPLKELLQGQLAKQRDLSGDDSKHYMLTILLEQTKRPTFQAHDAPKGRNTDRAHLLGLRPFRRAKLNLIVAGQCRSSEAEGGGRQFGGWQAVLDGVEDALERQGQGDEGPSGWGQCSLSLLLREPLMSAAGAPPHHASLVSWPRRLRHVSPGMRHARISLNLASSRCPLDAAAPCCSMRPTCRSLPLSP